MYISDWSGVHWVEENLEIEDVMETPEVGVGDLLLLCVNTIHATQTTDDRRLAVSLRTCDPKTPIDWHRVAGNPTPRMMRQLAGQSKLNFPVFQHVQEHDFGITLADIVPALTGEARVAVLSRGVLHRAGSMLIHSNCIKHRQRREVFVRRCPFPSHSSDYDEN